MDAFCLDLSVCEQHHNVFHADKWWIVYCFAGVLTASATSLSSRMKGSAVAMVEQVKSTRPAMISVSISGIPRNGTCKASKPAPKRNISAEMWVAEPTPAVLNVIEPGLALAAATR